MLTQLFVFKNKLQHNFWTLNKNIKYVFVVVCGCAHCL